jgi:5-methyltetrahydrofolate--homocysteine methyltransferase
MMRGALGIAGEGSPHVRDLFHQKYRGSRYSFGHPACPNLKDQTKLFPLLHSEENIGVRLTTGFLLEPKQSTSAIVVHHPGAKYFVVWDRPRISARPQGRKYKTINSSSTYSVPIFKARASHP